mmetsp:Transcript_4720/g.7135  ORF Transcript_4720/g.7135 Transcript_4720/m.7135 type:complete len:101 (+) Transcript_4720:209-511(+)
MYLIPHFDLVLFSSIYLIFVPRPLSFSSHTNINTLPPKNKHPLQQQQKPYESGIDNHMATANGGSTTTVNVAVSHAPTLSHASYTQLSVPSNPRFGINVT